MRKLTLCLHLAFLFLVCLPCSMRNMEKRTDQKLHSIEQDAYSCTKIAMIIFKLFSWNNWCCRSLITCVCGGVWIYFFFFCKWNQTKTMLLTSCKLHARFFRYKPLKVTQVVQNFWIRRQEAVAALALTSSNRMTSSYHSLSSLKTLMYNCSDHSRQSIVNKRREAPDLWNPKRPQINN